MPSSALGNLEWRAGKNNEILAQVLESLPWWGLTRTSFMWSVDAATLIRMADLSSVMRSGHHARTS